MWLGLHKTKNSSRKLEKTTISNRNEVIQFFQNRYTFQYMFLVLVDNDTDTEISKPLSIYQSGLVQTITLSYVDRFLIYKAGIINAHEDAVDPHVDTFTVRSLLSALL